jgi:hypothetical protein
VFDTFADFDAPCTFDECNIYDDFVLHDFDESVTFD